jgi:hypothetical protein
MRISPASIAILPAARWKQARRQHRLVLITDLALAIMAFSIGGSFHFRLSLMAITTPRHCFINRMAVQYEC